MALGSHWDDIPEEISRWEPIFLARVRGTGPNDPAHDVAHIRRVVRNARRIAQREGAKLEIVVPAAWLHDIVIMKKDNPERHRASALAANAAVQFLREQKYPTEWLDAIHHAVEAHSFSAKIAPTTLEAQVVQDADRLDALGAVGIARCFATSGVMGRPLYSEEDPFGTERPLDDRAFALDHFKVKLFKIGETLCTASARAEAAERIRFLHKYTEQLISEIEG